MLPHHAHLAIAAALRVTPAADVAAQIAEEEVDRVLLRLGVRLGDPAWARVVADVRGEIAAARFSPALSRDTPEPAIRAAACAALVEAVRRHAPEGARVVPVGAGVEIELDGAFGFARAVSVPGPRAA